MSRKPIIGNVIHYQISFDTNGKPRAVNARIEGVGQGQALTLLPLEQVSKATRPSSAKESPYKNLTTRVNKPKKSLNLFPVLIVIGTAIFVYNKVAKEKTFINQIITPNLIRHGMIVKALWNKLI